MVRLAAELLHAPSFAQRLQTYLNQARSSLGLRAIGILELAAQEGSVAPMWRIALPEPCVPATVDLEHFRRLLREPIHRPANNPDVQALGEPFCEEQTAVIPLQLQPRFETGPDCLLVLAGEEEALATASVTQLTHDLEQALCTDRRSRISESVFQAVEQAADPMELTDQQARLLYANRAWEETFGYKVKDVVGQTVGRLFRDPVAPIHDIAFYQFTLATLADGRAWTGALACRTRDGQRVFCEPMVSPFTAESQALQGNFAVRRNLAQRVARDEALAVAHHEFRAVLSATPDGVAVLREGKVYFLNTAFLNIVQYDEPEVIGRSYLDFIHPEDHETFNQASNRGLVRVRMVRSDGSLRYVETCSAGAVSFEGKPAVILLSRDVTDYRVAEEQLARAEKLSALGSLAAGVAHEINNPLTYILLNLEYVRHKLTHPPAELEALDAAIEGAERIQNIVCELRGYTGTDVPGPPQPVLLTQAIRAAVNIAANEIRHRATLSQEHEPGVHALAREGPLVQILVNLLVNAAQAIRGTALENTIRIGSGRAGPDRIAIEVSDTGVGIAATDLPHVFDPFATTKPRGEGSGLGLAISKRIAESFGGRIQIRSAIGQGTTVRVELPFAAAPSVIRAVKPAPAPTPLSTSPAPSPQGDRARPRHMSPTRLLIVDDETAVAESIRKMLTHYDIAIAKGADEALATLGADGPFDVVLCDLMMPGIAGPQLYARACQSYPELSSRFIFMTGGAFTDWAREFLDHTQCPSLMKPFSLSVMRKLIESLITAAPSAHSR